MRDFVSVSDEAGARSQAICNLVNWLLRNEKVQVAHLVNLTAGELAAMLAANDDMSVVATQPRLQPREAKIGKERYQTFLVGTWAPGLLALRECQASQLTAIVAFV